MALGVAADQADQGDRAARAAMLRATLPAPPSIFSSRDRASTGIGASGETRLTSP